MTTARYVVSRLLQGAITLLGALTVSFFLLSAAGSAAQARAGLEATPATLRQISRALGLDHPILQRFADYITSAAHGDFGQSYRTGGSALGLVGEAIPHTLELCAAAMTLALVLALPLAIRSVLRRDGLGNGATRLVLMVAQGIPEFWLALVLVLVFGVSLHLLPAIGNSGADSIVLPALALALPMCPTIVRLLRAQLLDVMAMDFVQGLRGKGLSERDIVLRHALRNAAGPSLTILALQLGWLLGGTLIVEIVFSWPGIGELLYESVQQRDLPTIQAVIVVVAFGYVALNLLADLAVMWIDPRVRLAGHGR